MSVVWPATLPQKPLPYEYGEEEPDNLIKQRPSGGLNITRPRVTLDGETLKVAFAMTRAQRAAFRTFYRTSLKWGSLPFQWVHPETEETADFYITDPPAYSFIGGESADTVLWKVNLNLYRKP